MAPYMLDRMLNLHRSDDVCDESRVYLVMELVRGTALNRLIPKTGLAPSEAVSYACGIADGLEAAHAAGIIHRDVACYPLDS